jgi:hypothetical protein
MLNCVVCISVINCKLSKGYTIQICKHEDSTVCPVSTLGSYLGFRPNFQGPLFCHFDGKSLSSYQYTAVLKKPLALNVFVKYLNIRMLNCVVCISVINCKLSYPEETMEDQCESSCKQFYLKLWSANAGEVISMVNLCSYQYTAVLKKTLALLGHDTANYKSHSFRIGMATTLTLEGFTDDQIKAMGRWKSGCLDVIKPLLPCQHVVVWKRSDNLKFS